MTLDLTSPVALRRRRLRARELYTRLPEIYRVRDWQRAFERYGEERVRAGEAVPELEAFLGLIADEVIRLRDNIGELWDDFFIETCAEWVVPYLGELLGANLVFNAAQRNRVDVANTIEWRRRKGMLTMLADLTGDITGWEAEAAEFFENLGWSQNPDHLKPNHAQAPDLRDPPYRLNLLGTARDPWQHTVDVRHPQGRQGWYHPKTVGLFLSRLNAYPLLGVTPQPHDASQRASENSLDSLKARVLAGVTNREDAVGERYQTVSQGCFTFDPLGREIPLFDRQRRQPIAALAYARDPYAFFGDQDGFAIRQHGILIATNRPPTPEPTEAEALWTDFRDDPLTHLKAETGLEWMEPEKFENPMRRFEITALWGNDFSGPLTTLGSLRNFSTPFTLADPATPSGVFMLNLKLGAGSDAALFPATVIAVRNDRANPRVADSRASRYQDALYVYLPEVALAQGDELNLYVADDGSTYYAQAGAPHLGPPDVTRDSALDHTLLARAALGQCFPARRLSNSLDPSDIVDLHHIAGLRLANAALFHNRRFMIEARLYAPDLERLNRVDNWVGQLRTDSAYLRNTDPKVFIGEGDRLVLKISRGPLSTEVFFPMTDLIVTDRSGRALLVALPEMDFSTDSRAVWLFFDTEGATYYASNDYGHDTALARPERGAAFRFDSQDKNSGLARKSAGQVLTLPDRFPIQQRTPMYTNLCHWEHPKPRPARPGQLAVDPARGRFCFAPGEAPQAQLKSPSPAASSASGLSVDYYEGFAHDVGALTYDRYPSLKAPENPPPTRFVAHSGDADCGAAPVYSTLAEALQAAQDGDVIQIEDSATYEHPANLIIPGSLKRLVIQSANRQRPCLHFTGGAKLCVMGAMDALRLNGLLISGAALEIADASQVKQIELIACSLDPTARQIALRTHEGPTSKPLAQISLCRCISGGLKLRSGVAELIVSDSILDRQGGRVIQTNGLAHLERVTAWGTANVRQLYASECLLVDAFSVSDRQAGCVRYSRFQTGSQLPRCFQCVPADNNLAFNSQRFGRPDYAQLHLNCSEAILVGAEGGAEVGAFNGALATLRAKNLGVKLDEYLPVGLTPALIYVT